jgi:hypothetical protein
MSANCKKPWTLAKCIQSCKLQQWKNNNAQTGPRTRIHNKNYMITICNNFSVRLTENPVHTFFSSFTHTPSVSSRRFERGPVANVGDNTKRDGKDLVFIWLFYLFFFFFFFIIFFHSFDGHAVLFPTHLLYTGDRSALIHIGWTDGRTCRSLNPIFINTRYARTSFCDAWKGTYETEGMRWVEMDCGRRDSEIWRKDLC